MVPYWMLFSLCGFAALISRPSLDPRDRRGAWLALFGLFLALMIGFRWGVGGDWGSETRMLRIIRNLDLIDALRALDPAFGLVVWIEAQDGYNIWQMNLFAGVVFTIGLVFFCKNEPHPWLAATVAIPYLVIVVAMGYTRQSAAIGMAMSAFVMLQRRAISRFLVFVLLGATMHSTAVLLFPLGIIGSRVSKTAALLLGGPVFLIAFTYLLQDKVDTFIGGYVTAAYSSSGALIRVSMNVIAAALFLLFRNRFQLSPEQRALITTLSIVALLFLVALFTTSSSTAVDRMALYIIPLQLFVFGRLPTALGRSDSERRMLTLGVIVYSLAIMLVWLNFADNAASWIPYQIFPVEYLEGDYIE